MPLDIHGNRDILDDPWLEVFFMSLVCVLIRVLAAKIANLYYALWYSLPISLTAIKKTMVLYSLLLYKSLSSYGVCGACFIHTPSSLVGTYLNQITPLTSLPNSWLWSLETNYQIAKEYAALFPDTFLWGGTIWETFTDRHESYITWCQCFVNWCILG